MVVTAVQLNSVVSVERNGERLEVLMVEVWELDFFQDLSHFMLCQWCRHHSLENVFVEVAALLFLHLLKLFVCDFSILINWSAEVIQGPAVLWPLIYIEIVQRSVFGKYWRTGHFEKVTNLRQVLVFFLLRIIVFTKPWSVWSSEEPIGNGLSILNFCLHRRNLLLLTHLINWSLLCKSVLVIDWSDVLGVRGWFEEALLASNSLVFTLVHWVALGNIRSAHLKWIECEKRLCCLICLWLALGHWPDLFRLLVHYLLLEKN